MFGGWFGVFFASRESGIHSHPISTYFAEMLGGVKILSSEWS